MHKSIKNPEDAKSAKSIDRRSLLKLLTASALAPRLAPPWPALASAPRALTPADEALLDDIQRRGCLFFAEQASPRTGQVLDRAKGHTDSGALDSRRMAAIALATWCDLPPTC